MGHQQQREERVEGGRGGNGQSRLAREPAGPKLPRKRVSNFGPGVNLEREGGEGVEGSLLTYLPEQGTNNTWGYSIGQSVNNTDMDSAIDPLRRGG